MVPEPVSSTTDQRSHPISPPTVFVDLDAALVELRPSGRRRADLVLRPNACEGLRRLREAARVVILVDPAGRDPLLAHQRDEREAFLLRHAGSAVAKRSVVGCDHLPEQSCQCRKPQLGLLERAQAELGLDLTGGSIVGGNADVATGHRAGLYSVRIGPLDNESAGPALTPDYEARDLLDAANWVLLREALGIAS